MKFSVNTLIRVYQLRRTFTVRSVATSLLGVDQRVFVVSTCSKGIGFEFAKQLLQRSQSSSRVVGLYRSMNDHLAQLKQQNTNRLDLVKVDLEDQLSVDAAASEVMRLTNKIDLLVNVAGILGDGISSPGPERSVFNIDRDWLVKSFQVNLIEHSLCQLQ